MSKPGKLEEGETYLGDYLLDRLAEHAKIAMSVPGDFNLAFLDLPKSIKLCGNANELNAAYAADGYARVKQANANYDDRISDNPSRGGVRGLGVLITTFGVGELSALNGVAGAYAERIPIVHIVGVPSTDLQEQGSMLHHTLGDGKFDVFAKAALGVSKAQAILTSAIGATDEIDRIIRVALTEARPVYITLPTNLVFAPVSSTPLKTPLMSQIVEKSKAEKGVKEEKETLEFVTSEIGRLWNNAKNPIIIVDACAIRFGVTHLVQDLVDVTKARYYTTPMGKGGLPEDYERGFGGVYVGAITNPDVKEAVESADLTILVGGLLSDFNSGEFTHKTKTIEKIELHSDHTVVQYALSFHDLLPSLIKTLKPKPNSDATKTSPAHLGYPTKIPDGPSDKMVKQAAFWPMWGEFFEENDIIIAETGTSSFGMIDVKLPSGSTFISQTLWGSIGYTGGATLGALFAAQEASVNRRTILFIGDGSLQLTVQELGTMIRYGLKPIIVVLNNDGYEIERQIHGKNAGYNDIAQWSWQKLIPFFNGGNLPAKSWQANTRGELEKILRDEEFKKADRFQLLEVKLEKHDAPRILIEQAKLSAKLNTD